MPSSSGGGECGAVRENSRQLSVFSCSVFQLSVRVSATIRERNWGIARSRGTAEAALHPKLQITCGLFRCRLVRAG